MLAAARFDLDSDRRFTDGWLVATDRRLLSSEAEGSPEECWPVGPDTAVSVRLRGSIGTFELSGLSRDGGSIRRWCFTPGRAESLHRLAAAIATRRQQATARGTRPPGPERDGPGSDPATGQTSAEFDDALETEAPQGWRSLLRVLAFARPHAAMAALGCGLSLASTAAALVPPYLTMPLVDDVLIPRQAGREVPFGVVTGYLAGLAAAATCAWLLFWAQTWVLAHVSERISADLRVKTYSHLLGLSLDWFGRRRTGDLMSRVGRDTEGINVFLSVNLIEFLANLLLLLLTAAVLLWIDPWLTLVTLAPFPAIFWVVYLVRERLRRGFRDADTAWSDMTSVLADAIPGIRVVKAFAQEERERARFRQANDAVVAANDRVNLVWAFCGPLIAYLNEMGLVVVWTAGAWLVFGGSVTVGTLTAFLAYIARFYGRIESMIRMVPATQRAAASARRIFEVLDCTPTVAEAERPVRPGRPRGLIEIDRVHFRYGPREVLRGVDLVIQPGEMIGLVGRSGSGKSTLANLVCRFQDPSSGTIRIDGTDLRQLAVDDYRRNLGIVLQEPFLFFGSVAENIAYGRPDAPRDEIVAAARAAGAHEFILGLPAGYDSRVGERGTGLSGGERQRISIARALLVDPAILILDEATSSVDARTEAVIQSAIDRLVTGRTTIAIAHRLSTLRRADRIVVLDGGSIVEVGTHERLLEAGGAYAHLHRAQSQADDS
jgi:ATP-binding cassette subfamily B protein